MLEGIAQKHWITDGEFAINFTTAIKGAKTRSFFSYKKKKKESENASLSLPKSQSKFCWIGPVKYLESAKLTCQAPRSSKGAVLLYIN